ncbi:MAG: GTPase [Anaerolineales bacterium]
MSGSPGRTERGRLDQISDQVRLAWDELPPETRRTLSGTLESLPDSLKGWRGLIDRAVQHVQNVVGDRSSVAIVGPANAGKSTLYNQLIRRGQPQAEVSAVPGTTRQPQSADAGLFSLVDTPGADAAGPTGEAERTRALDTAAEADVLVVLFDASHGVSKAEQGLLADLRAMGKPLVVALNKMDLISKGERGPVLGKAAATLGLSSERLIPVSAKQGDGLDRVLLDIARVEPGIVAALGEALPAYRWQLAQGVIARAASTSAAIAVTPLPIVDFIPLLGVQASMVLSIARIYNYRLTPARARELVVTLGAAVLGRSLFYELSKFGGPPGWLVAAAVAVGMTASLGYATAVWFERGLKLPRQRLSEISRAVSQALIERLKDVGRRRPDRKTLRARIDESLETVPSPSTEGAAETPSASGGANNPLK